MAHVVHTGRFVGGNDTEDNTEMGESLGTLLLAGRTSLTQKMRFGSKEARDQVLQTGMTDGMGRSYDRLEQVLEEQPVS